MEMWNVSEIKVMAYHDGQKPQRLAIPCNAVSHTPIRIKPLMDASGENIELNKFEDAYVIVKGIDPGKIEEIEWEPTHLSFYRPDNKDKPEVYGIKRIERLSEPDTLRFVLMFS